jgi:transposase InsO family protein
MEAKLEQIWKDSGYPAAQRLYAIVKRTEPDVKLKDVQNFIASQETAQLHKRAPKDTKSHHITSAGNHLDYQADLLDLAKYARQNRGMNWILLVEDIFNRKSYAAPLKTKSPNDVLPALNKAFEYLGKPQLTLVTDSGTEFKGVVGKKLKELHIVHHTVEVGDSRTLGMINSLCRFFKNAIHRHFTQTQDTNWVDYLPTLLKSYNNTPHSSLKGMTPLEAEKRQTDTRNITYEKVMKDKKPSKFEIGDTVRVLKQKTVFGRGYEIRYSIERFKIEKIEGKNYVLSNGKSFREHELQKVLPQKEEVPVIVEGKASEIEAIEEKPEKKDVAAAAKFEHRTEQILKHKEGVAQSNRREGLRERKPQSQVEHPKFGQIKW